MSVVMFATNEMAQQETAATSKASITTAVQKAKLIGDCMLMVPAKPDRTGTIVWETYVQNLYDVADSENIPLLDWTYRFIDRTTSGAAYSDTDHMTIGSHRDISSVIFQALT